MRDDAGVQDKNKSIRLPSDLVEKIDKMAEDERRSWSQMAMMLLEEALKARETLS